MGLGTCGILLAQVPAQAGAVGDYLSATWCGHMGAEGQRGGVGTSCVLSSCAFTSPQYAAGHRDGPEDAGGGLQMWHGGEGIWVASRATLGSLGSPSAQTGMLIEPCSIKKPLKV